MLGRSGVSKATLYTGSPDKRLLFSEVMQRECDRLTGAARRGTRSTLAPRRKPC
ncbi:hypothetical protein LZ189_27615 [Rhodovulum sulfidophilum]|nr:hypothetical protein [Rhodovulum sulfidophilum]